MNLHNIITEIFERLEEFLDAILIQMTGGKHQYTGRFGKVRKVLRYSHKQNGLRIGNKYISLKQTLNGGMLLIGKTGVGKSTKIFFQNLYGAGKMIPTSFVCLDPTGELREQSISYLTEELDYREDIFNMSDASKSTVSWNPIENIPEEQIDRFSGELVAINSEESPKDPIWNNMSSKLISIIIRLLRCIDTKECINLYNVRYLVTLIQGDTEKVNILLSRFATDSLFLDYKAFISNDQKFLNSVLSSTLSILQQWSDINVIKTTSSTSFSMESYRLEKRILFIQNDIMSQDYLKNLNSLFLKEWFSFITRQGIPDSKSNVLAFLIDEASSLKMSRKDFIPFVVSQIRKYRAYGIWSYQSFSQCESLLGKEGAQTLKANTGTVLFLGNQNLATGKEISQSLGRYTYKEGDKTHTREVLTPEEAMYLDGATEGGILLCGSERPMKIKRIKAYYQNHTFKKWSEKPAPPIIEGQQEMPPLLPIDELIKDINSNKTTTL